jgi:hypothetical protein
MLSIIRLISPAIRATAPYRVAIDHIGPIHGVLSRGAKRPISARVAAIPSAGKIAVLPIRATAR